MKKLIILIDDDVNTPKYAASELGIDEKYFIHISQFLNSQNILQYEQYEKCYTIYNFATYDHDLICRLQTLGVKSIAFRTEHMRQFISGLDKPKPSSNDEKNINKLKDIALEENLHVLYIIIKRFEDMVAKGKQITWVEYLQNIILNKCRKGEM